VTVIRAAAVRRPLGVLSAINRSAADGVATGVDDDDGADGEEEEEERDITPTTLCSADA
jgi:hypothetical protein